MVWGRTSDRDEHSRRSLALTGQTGRRAVREGRSGRRGGAPIWNMGEAWMPKRSKGRWSRTAPYRTALAGGHDAATRPAYEGPRGLPFVGDDGAVGDPDGFAVFGRYPKGWLTHVIRIQLLGAVRRHEILHVCSGTLGPDERWTVDLRAEARPRVVADGVHLPFRDASFKAVMLDPPYTDAYARNLYGTENPRPAWLLREAARVVQPCGRIGFMHVVIPFSPPDCRFVGTFGISVGVGFRGRFFTVYEKAQDGLF